MKTGREWWVFAIIGCVPVILALQPLIEKMIVTDREDDLDFSAPLEPPPSEEESAWSRERLYAQQQT